MALSGDFNDLYIKQYRDMIDHELQQNASVLRNLVTVENVEGSTSYFNKLGKSSSYTITGRRQEVDVQDPTFERRYVTPVAIEAAHQIELIDAVRYMSQPNAELVSSISQELGRQIDGKIAASLFGTAGRELAGAVSNASFDSNFAIAVNSNTLVSTVTAGDTGLHEGKLLQAKKKLQAAYALAPGDEIFVVAPANQLAGLSARLSSLGGGAFHRHDMPKINMPMLDQTLDGAFGMRFIQFENLGVDSNSDELVAVFVKKAIKFGVWRDINFTMSERVDQKGSPMLIKANMVIGASRMWEEGVVKIACDPTNLYAAA